MGKVADGVYAELTGPQKFTAKVLENTTLPAQDQQALVEFLKDVAELSHAVQGAVEAANDLADKITLIKQALHRTPNASGELMKQARVMEKQTREIRRVLLGDRTISRRYGNQPPSVSSRIRRVVSGHWRSTSAPTQTMRDQYRIAGEEFEPQLEKLQKLIEIDLKNIEKALEEAGAPWTPGRIPRWKKK